MARAQFGWVDSNTPRRHMLVKFVMQLGCQFIHLLQVGYPFLQGKRLDLQSLDIVVLSAMGKKLRNPFLLLQKPGNSERKVIYGVPEMQKLVTCSYTIV